MARGRRRRGGELRADACSARLRHRARIVRGVALGRLGRVRHHLQDRHRPLSHRHRHDRLVARRLHRRPAAVAMDRRSQRRSLLPRHRAWLHRLGVRFCAWRGAAGDACDQPARRRGDRCFARCCDRRQPVRSDGRLCRHPVPRRHACRAERRQRPGFARRDGAAVHQQLRQRQRSEARRPPVRRQGRGRAHRAQPGRCRKARQ